jgi:hypothetical protein
MLRQAAHSWTIRLTQTCVAGAFGYGAGMDLDRRFVVAAGPEMRSESALSFGKLPANPTTILP